MNTTTSPSLETLSARAASCRAPWAYRDLVAALVAAPNPEFQRAVERLPTSLLVDLAGYLQLRVGVGRSLRLAYLGAVRAHIARARRQLTLPFATVS
jgi:hypothetical protein